jgi:predicted transcriptional regulator
VQFTKLEMQDQFNQLKKGNVVICRWKEGSRQYKELGEITHHNFYEINRSNEMILNKFRNDYFNISMYLKCTSYVSEVYLVTI